MNVEDTQDFKDFRDEASGVAQSLHDTFAKYLVVRHKDSVVDVPDSLKEKIDCNKEDMVFAMTATPETIQALMSGLTYFYIKTLKMIGVKDSGINELLKKHLEFFE